MARVCELTGKRKLYGNKVSHSNRKTRISWLPNLKRKKYLIPELGLTQTFYLSTDAIKTIDKQGGISNAVMKVKEEYLSDALLKIKFKLLKKTRIGSKKAAAAAQA